MIEQAIQGKAGFAVGTGRCGTRFVSEVAGLEPGVASSHERNAYNESFHRYCKWYDLPVDSAGFLAAKREEIEGDLAIAGYSFEASGYLSFSIKELYESFGAKFLLMLRRPDKVINSFLFKGWYGKPYICGKPNLAPGYQEHEAEWFNHFLARIAPRGDEFIRWNKLTRVGKLAWYWTALNSSVLQQFAELPASQSMVVKLEELNYVKYLEVADFLGYESAIGREKFESLAYNPPNQFRDYRGAAVWSDREHGEFEAQVKALADRFAYPIDHESLREKPSGQKPKLRPRVRQKIGDSMLKLLGGYRRVNDSIVSRLEKMLR
ncbi:MAG: hypothetical protein FVQ81_08610 [Candidatus Glassbacteria bacterium]|nr:hypothetical protein [Candidatus Glassbacteria bacterium]